MQKLTDEVTWYGIGAPQGDAAIERSAFAGTVRQLIEEAGYVFERKKGGAAATRGEGASGWHIWGWTLPELVDAPEEPQEEPVSRKRRVEGDALVCASPKRQCGESSTSTGNGVRDDIGDDDSDDDDL
jgi:hypothetical protein